MAGMTSKEQALFDAMRPFAVALAGRGIKPEEIVNLQMGELADLIAVLLGHKGTASRKSDSAPLPSDEGAIAGEVTIEGNSFKLLRPMWKKDKEE